MWLLESGIWSKPRVKPKGEGIVEANQRNRSMDMPFPSIVSARYHLNIGQHTTEGGTWSSIVGYLVGRELFSMVRMSCRDFSYHFAIRRVRVPVAINSRFQLSDWEVDSVHRVLVIVAEFHNDIYPIFNYRCESEMSGIGFTHSSSRVDGL